MSSENLVLMFELFLILIIAIVLIIKRNKTKPSTTPPVIHIISVVLTGAGIVFIFGFSVISCMAGGFLCDAVLSSLGFFDSIHKFFGSLPYYFLPIILVIVMFFIYLIIKFLKKIAKKIIQKNDELRINNKFFKC
jgi:hypothetical protein